MKYYEVQSIYGTYRAFFRIKANALKYQRMLNEHLGDDGLTEISEFFDEPGDVIVTVD